MPKAQIIALTTNEIGENGPVKRIYALGFQSAELAMEAMSGRLKPGEVAIWLDARDLNIVEGEVRLI